MYGVVRLGSEPDYTFRLVCPRCVHQEWEEEGEWTPGHANFEAGGLGVDVNYSLWDILLCVHFHGCFLCSSRNIYLQKKLTVNLAKMVNLVKISSAPSLFIWWSYWWFLPNISPYLLLAGLILSTATGYLSGLGPLLPCPSSLPTPNQHG